jgi:hypothetical protein
VGQRYKKTGHEPNPERVGATLAVALKFDRKKFITHFNDFIFGFKKNVFIFAA